MTRWWLSWEQATEDPRPIVTDLPGVLGWWVSGEGPSYHTLCALVETETPEESAVYGVICRGWPEQEGRPWRIIETKPGDWEPGDRFPMPGKEQKS